ncbi:MAG: hypothetical protein KJ063_25110 [Anaerolineae bacterium]|nr:hypothetical protein [Anaerolineae bacterium]
MRGWIIIGCWLSIIFAGCDKQPKHSATPDFSQTAIFQQRTPEGMALYLWPIQATDPQKIITLPYSERYELAPDGLHLAIYFGENIRLIDLITFEEVVLAEDVILPIQFIENISHQFLSWSPDGDKLAVLMGGPSWPDTSVINTTVVVLDLEQQAPDFVYDNGTFINEVAWSADSTLISFPEIEVPCYYTESCQRGEEEMIWSLTTLTHSSDNEWAFLSSTRLDPIGELSWRQNSICKLNISPTNDLIVYQSPCTLGYIPFDANRFIAPIRTSNPILPILSEQPDPKYDTGGRYLTMHWLGKTNNFILGFQNNVLDAESGERKSYSTWELYKYETTGITLLSKIDMEGYNLTVPLSSFSLSIISSPDDQFALHTLEDNHVLLAQLNDDLIMSATFLEIPTISANGLWLPEGYLTQSENNLIFIHAETGEWEVVRDDLPEGFTLVGWQILE